MDRLARVRVRVYGRVQGVGFRVFARGKALARGLTGYVRNLSDGSVEACAEGFREDIQAFISDLRAGPKFASVERVDVEWEEFRGEFVSFQIR